MDNQSQQIGLQDIPNNPNDFVPDILPAQSQAMPQPLPELPQRVPEVKQPEAEKKETPDRGETAAVSPEIASLFGEETKQSDNAEDVPKQAGLSKAELFDRLMTDESFRKAFIGKYEPDMIKSIDPEAFAFQKLNEEFGSDFIDDEFNVSESGIPGTKSFRYIKKYNEYISEAEAKAKQSVPEDFEQLLKSYEKSAEHEQAKLQQEKTQVMKMYNWSEQTFDGFISFASKLGLIDLAYIYDKAQKAKQTAGRRQISPVLMAPGSANNENIYQEMVNVFGPPISS